MFSLLFVVVFGYTKHQIQRNQLRYKIYHECLRKREDSFRKKKDSPAAENVVETAGTDIILNCLSCLTPQEEDAVEDLWKPNENVLGRKLGDLWNKFKVFLSGNNDTAAEVTYGWDYMPFQQRADWKPAIDLTEPKTLTRKAIKALEGLFKTKTKLKIGSHFELLISDLNQTDTGWYRCSKRTPQEYITSLYFVQVVRPPNVIIKHINSSAKSEPSLKDREIRIPTYKQFHDYNLVAYKKHTDWSPCNLCGPTIGESLRRVQCYVKPLDKFPTSSPFAAIFELFGSLPCNSALLPLRIRRQLKKYPEVQEFKFCKRKCISPENETRVVEKVDKTGRKVVHDIIPPKEYSFFERLPLLKPSVSRKVVNIIEGTDFLVFDCGQSGVYWHRGYKPITQDKYLQAGEKRFYLTSDGELVIRDVELGDQDLYSCFDSEERLLRSFKLIVKPGDRTTEVVSYSRMLIRYSSTLLLLILVMGLVAIQH
ncbi:unnamed protein product [Bursaphelenchus xylophilus]|uniref:(pine wood nematode) hypothetical protein n=1 Tax=Bursaphelenchus xylophilus TaxID=6326 RepID=A0A1I7RH80_BURXY|nr:unnamed protein product [Bursaphelenchus xylophilus]CAG9115943.1 unnamed protein product [Bursaphelenchus xylophilus]